MAHALAVKELEDLGLDVLAELVKKTTTQAQVNTALKATKQVCKLLDSVNNKSKKSILALKNQTRGNKQKVADAKASIKRIAVQAALDSAKTDAKVASAENNARLASLPKLEAAIAAKAAGADGGEVLAEESVRKRFRAPGPRARAAAAAADDDDDDDEEEEEEEDDDDDDDDDDEEEEEDDDEEDDDDDDDDDEPSSKRKKGLGAVLSTIERIGNNNPEAANDSTGFDNHGFHFGATVSRKGRVKINAGKSRKTTTRDSAALKALRLKSLRRKFKRNKK